MTVYKRGDVYWFEFFWNGERIRQSTKSSNKRAAESIESAYRVKLAQGEVGIFEKKSVPSFSAAMKDFLAWSKQQHAAHPKTYTRYEVSSKPLLNFFDKKYGINLRLDEITPEMIEKYKVERLKGKSKATGRVLRPATVNRELACLKILFNHYIKQDVIVKNPVSRIKFLDENNEQMRVVSLDEESLYLAAATQPLRDIAILMLQTGCRPQEIFRLCVNNIDLQNKYMQISSGKTKAARRRIPLSKAALEILERRIANAETANLFPHPNDPDKPMAAINFAHSQALKQCGLKFRLYDLRHTFATRAAMSGVDLVTLAALLGHSRVQMVLRYAHPVEEQKINAIRRLEAFNFDQEKNAPVAAELVN